MDTINNNISKFNGKYLKCIVSNYTSSKNYLGNSGSLIIIQPKSGKLNDIELEQDYENGVIHRNYVYLGNEFLASGFGFASQFVLEKAEDIVNTYDKTIASLKQKDIDLDKRITNEINALWDELKKYVKTYGGQIENTFVNLNGYNILTKDIILYGEEAQYKNLEVNKVIFSINGIRCNNSIILVPIGSVLKNINVELEVSKNDSGGILSLEILHHLDNEENEYEGTKIKYNLDTDILIDEDYQKYKVFYTKDLSDFYNDYIIDSYKKDIIKSIYINVKETPATAYKYYPGLYRKYGFKITSSGNAIVNNVIDINEKLDIRPQYYAKCSENGILEDHYFTKHLPLNSFIDYDTTSIIFDINEQMNNNHYIYVAIPSNFSVNKIYIIKNHTDKFNWTGAVNIIRNKKMTCVNTNPYNPYYINYDIYYLYASHGFYEDINSKYAVEFQIIYDNVKDDEIIDNDYSNNLPTSHPLQSDLILTSNNKDTINDEEFNDLYWINYNSNYNSNLSSLKQKLHNVSINGAVK